MEGRTYQSLGNALKALRVAEDELNRPAEDVVTACSCHYTRMALQGLLRTFLLHNQAFVDPALNSEELLALCSKVEPEFAKFNLFAFACGHQPGAADMNSLFCLSTERGNECLVITHAIKDLVISRLKVREMDFV